MLQANHMKKNITIQFLKSLSILIPFEATSSKPVIFQVSYYNGGMICLFISLYGEFT